VDLKQIRDLLAGHTTFGELQYALEQLDKIIEREESFAGQAYQVIGNIVSDLDVHNDQTEKALDYFSNGEYDDDFLPWGLDDIAPDIKQRFKFTPLRTKEETRVLLKEINKITDKDRRIEMLHAALNPPFVVEEIEE